MHEPIELKNINLSYFCRRCKQQVRGIPITDPVYHISEFSDDPWLICRCPTRLCVLSFVVYNKLNDRIYEVYPLPNFSANDYHEAIPEKVREDLAESDRCLNAQAYKAVVVMCRRAIQNIVLDKISDGSISDASVKNKKLYEQIDALFTSGLITKDLKETAHEIRHFGNFGAHPSDDVLDNTTREDAKMIDKLSFDLVQAIYIIPYQTAQLRAKRTQKP